MAIASPVPWNRVMQAVNTRSGVAKPQSFRILAGAGGVLTLCFLILAAGFLAADLFSLVGPESAPAVVAKAPTSTPKRTAASADQTWLSFFGRSVLNVANFIALAVIAPLVTTLCLFGLMRRYGKHLGPLIHVEQVGTPNVVGPFTASALGFSPPEMMTAQPVDLGPSFEEERQRQAGQMGRMQAGVLLQLFEDNVKLQEKIELAKEMEQANTEQVSQ